MARQELDRTRRLLVLRDSVHRPSVLFEPRLRLMHPILRCCSWPASRAHRARSGGGQYHAARADRRDRTIASATFNKFQRGRVRRLRYPAGTSSQDQMHDEANGPDPGERSSRLTPTPVVG